MTDAVNNPGSLRAAAQAVVEYGATSPWSVSKTLRRHIDALRTALAQPEGKPQATSSEQRCRRCGDNYSVRFTYGRFETKTFAQGIQEERDRCVRICLSPGPLFGEEERYYGTLIAEAIQRVDAIPQDPTIQTMIDDMNGEIEG